MTVFPLDPFEVLVAPAAPSPAPIFIASDGTDFVVVYSDSSLAAHAVRVRGSDGTVLDPNGGPLLDSTMQNPCGLAWDGTNYGVSWTAPAPGLNGSDLRFGRLERAGLTILDPGGVLVSNAATQTQCGAIVFDGTNHVLTWSDYRAPGPGIYAGRVRPDGVLLDGPPSAGGKVVATAANGDSLGVASSTYGGGSMLVCDLHTPSGGVVVVHECRRVRTSDLATLDSAPITGLPVVAADFDGTSFFLTDADYAARIAASDGTVVGPTLLSPTPNGGSAHAALAGANHLVFWFDVSATVPATVHWKDARVRPSDFMVLDPGGIVVPRSASDEGPPALASNCTDVFGAWVDSREQPSQASIYGARINGATGMPLDSPAQRVYDEFVPFAFGRGVAAYDGSRYVVAWEESNGVRMLRLAPTTNVAFLPSASNPSLACDAANCLLTGGSGTVTRVRSSDDAVLGTTMLWSSGQTFATASDGANFLVVANVGGQLVAKRLVSASGAVLDGDASAPGIVVSSTPAGLASIAFDGTLFLVVWADIDGVRGARVSTAGALLDGPPSQRGFSIASVTTAIQGPLGATFDGRAFVGTWLARMFQAPFVSDLTSTRQSARRSALDRRDATRT